MKEWVKATIDRLLPPVPDAVRGQLTLVQFDRMREQIPLLYITLSLNLFAAILAGAPDTPFWMRWGVPSVVLVCSIYRMFVWIKRRNRQYSPAEAAKMLKRAAGPFIFVGGLCSFWCVYTWFVDTTSYRFFAPVFIVMGAFATTYCLSSSRGSGILNMFISMLPITLIMMLSGEILSMAVGTSFLLGTIFLGRMVMQQHDHLVDMLLLQKQMHEQARVDPLTGLLNRRALFEQLEAAIGDSVPGKRPAVAILDLDEFKPVNDGYGHAIGDKLLQQVAERMQNVCGSLVQIARLGGDEFAILSKSSDNGLSDDILDGIARVLNLPFRVDDLQLRVGVSIGSAVWSAEHIDMHCLLAEADERLYEAKAAHGGHGIRRSNFRGVQRG